MRGDVNRIRGKEFESDAVSQDLWLHRPLVGELQHNRLVLKHLMFEAPGLNLVQGYVARDII